MYLTKEQLEKVQMIQQELLDEFVRVCEENRLKYYLSYGSLIGAVRHNGPIPWDDDIDVGMPREDFEKFKKIMLARQDGGGDIFIDCFENDPTYRLRFAKLLRRGTRFCNQGRIMSDAKHMEVWIDIFPLDAAPNKITWAYRFHAWLIRQFATLRLIKVRNKKYLGFKGKLIKKLLFLLPYKTIVSWDSKLLRKYENRNTLYYVNWGSRYGAMKERMPNAWLEPSVKLLYNGKYYSAPKEWDKVLTQIYGDYMTLPPIEERKSHDVLDLQI